MARFDYTARDAGGAAQQGAIEAPSRREALRLLAARGLRPLAVTETGGPAGTPAAVAAHGPVRLSRKLRLPFLSSLSRLVGGGLSAGEAVRLLALRLQEPPLRSLAGGLWERLSQGRTLSDAMADFPAVFDGQTTSLIAAGEATGSLKDVLDRLIRHLTEQRELRSKIVAALAYPVFVCVLAVGVILFFLFFLLPRIQGLLGSLGGRLPLATQLLVWCADFLLHYGLFIVGAAVIGGVAWWRARQTPAGRKTTDAWLLRLPFTGSYARRILVLNFSHTVAILLENGITTAESLRMAERTITNLALRDILHTAVDRVLEGEALATALGRTQLFPLLVLDQLAVGEQTGNLPASLHAIAEDSQREMTSWLQYFTRFVASIVLGLAFAFVAFLAYAIVSAVLEVSASFKF
jgi:type II secretory pathway component PulF